MDTNINDNINPEDCGLILPVMSIATKFPNQYSIIDEFTLNREQRAAFMIITNHLNGDSQSRRGNQPKYVFENKIEHR